MGFEQRRSLSDRDRIKSMGMKEVPANCDAVFHPNSGDPEVDFARQDLYYGEHFDVHEVNAQGVAMIRPKEAAKIRDRMHEQASQKGLRAGEKAKFSGKEQIDEEDAQGIEIDTMIENDPDSLVRGGYLSVGAEQED